MIRVFLVDDHELFRSGARSALDARRFEIVGEASDVEGAVAGIRRSSPEVVSYPSCGSWRGPQSTLRKDGTGSPPGSIRFVPTWSGC